MTKFFRTTITLPTRLKKRIKECIKNKNINISKVCTEAVERALSRVESGFDKKHEYHVAGIPSSDNRDVWWIPYGTICSYPNDPDRADDIIIEEG